MDVSPGVAAKILRRFHQSDTTSQALLRIASVFGRVAPLSAVVFIYGRFRDAASSAPRGNEKISIAEELHVKKANRTECHEDPNEMIPLAFKVPTLIDARDAHILDSLSAEESNLASMSMTVERLKKSDFVQLHGDLDQLGKTTAEFYGKQSENESCYVSFRSDEERTVVFHELFVSDRKNIHEQILRWYKLRGPVRATEAAAMAAAAAESNDAEDRDPEAIVQAAAFAAAAAQHMYYGTLARHAISCDRREEALGHCSRAFMIALDDEMPEMALDYANDCAFMIATWDTGDPSKGDGCEDLEVALMLAVVHLELGQWDFALQHLERILEVTGYHKPKGCARLAHFWHRSRRVKTRLFAIMPEQSTKQKPLLNREAEELVVLRRREEHHAQRTEVIAERALALQKRIDKMLVRAKCLAPCFLHMSRAMT